MDSICVFDPQGVPQQLAAQLGEGGEGAVYRLQVRPDVAVKVYHPDVLARHGVALRGKIEAQVALFQHIPALQQLPLAWPRLSVFNEAGEWVGYAMKAAEGVPLKKLAHPVLQKQVFPGLTRRQITRRLISLLGTIEVLHQYRIFVGDINLNNFLTEPGKDDTVWLIDCDSMQVFDEQGRHFPCRVGVAEFTAPEHQKQSFDTVVRTAESDVYSLAILVFQCFMLGRHPFDQIDGGTPVQNMRKGHFPYGKTGIRPGMPGGIPPGPWYLQWSWLSFKLKNALCVTFREGGLQPTQRPRVRDWLKLLKEYEYSISNGLGGLCDELRPPLPKSQAGISQTAPGLSNSRPVFSTPFPI
ncbi:protein kinase domain-containing protein [Chitinilyticum piscinae]|uniref:Protein kinase domain-containing protein n=1 Tax=Chitinilyticum piscinae TaxID=2866724 RepID=A0A8J7FPL2_9NEIS|nr:hypothetical protein [Chitinilyticum piscinae]MBE9610831.1 hypothetical protein [Chitinilyticum piscinae]